MGPSAAPQSPALEPEQEEPAVALNEDVLAELRRLYHVRFLPTTVRGKTGRWVRVIMLARIRDARAAPDLYYVDNTYLGARTPGLQYSYRRAMGPRAPEAAPWGSYVCGRNAGDG